MLTERQCQLIERELTERPEPRKVGAYLCLNMGLMLSEVCALRLRDLDMALGKVNIASIAVKTQEGLSLLEADMPRSLPMPPHVRRFLGRCLELYQGEDSFIMTGSGEC